MRSAESVIRHDDKLIKRRIILISFVVSMLLSGWILYSSGNLIFLSLFFLVNLILTMYLAFKKTIIVSRSREITILVVSVDFAVCLSWVGLCYYLAHPIDATSISYIFLTGTLSSMGISYFISRVYPLSPGHRELINQLLSDEDKIDSIKFMSTYLEMSWKGEVIRQYMFIDVGNTKLKQVEKDEILLVFRHRSKYKWNIHDHDDDHKTDSFGRNIVLKKENSIAKL